MAVSDAFYARLIALQGNRGKAYGAGVVVFGAAFIVRILLGVDAALFPFYAAVIIAALMSGARVGALLLLLSLVVALSRTDRLSGVEFAAFAAICGVYLAVVAALERAFAERDAQRRRAEAADSRAEALLREQDHRFGNDLQAIAALLAIQARGVEAPAARRALDAATRRVNVFALVQRRMLAAEEARLDHDFIGEVAEDALAAAGMSGKVALDLAVAPTPLAKDALLPVVLILTEAIDNAIEHGLRDRADARLKLAAEAREGMIRVAVIDNGPGLPAGFDPARPKRSGMQIIQAFTRQLGGTFRVDNSGGAVSELTFPQKRTPPPEAPPRE